eukprot:scaffold860_cov72-Skeletonema_dohrnii-CCMP3373.AAC.1
MKSTVIPLALPAGSLLVSIAIGKTLLHFNHCRTKEKVILRRAYVTISPAASSSSISSKNSSANSRTAAGSASSSSIIGDGSTRHPKSIQVPSNFEQAAVPNRRKRKLDDIGMGTDAMKNDAMPKEDDERDYAAMEATVLQSEKDVWPEPPHPLPDVVQ